MFALITPRANCTRRKTLNRSTCRTVPARRSQCVQLITGGSALTIGCVRSGLIVFGYLPCSREW